MYHKVITLKKQLLQKFRCIYSHNIRRQKAVVLKNMTNTLRIFVERIQVYQKYLNELE